MFEEFMRTENEACVVRGYKLSFEKNELLVLVESIEGGVGVMARMITMRMVDVMVMAMFCSVCCCCACLLILCSDEQ